MLVLSLQINHLEEEKKKVFRKWKRTNIMHNVRDYISKNLLCVSRLKRFNRQQHYFNLSNADFIVSQIVAFQEKEKKKYLWKTVKVVVVYNAPILLINAVDVFVVANSLSPMVMTHIQNDFFFFVFLAPFIQNGFLWFFT